MKLIPKMLLGTDKLRVSKTYFPTIKLTKEYKNKLLRDSVIKNSQAVIYDTDKAKYYSDLQNFYNTNFFGYGIFGNPTNYDPSTYEGLQAILLNFDYSKGNMIDFTTNLGLGYLGFRFKPLIGKGYNGNIETYRPFIIGDGAESIVIDNSPNSVAKVSRIPIEEMELKNSVPGVSKSKYVGTMSVEGNEYPVYVQDKVKILGPEEFTEKEIDNIMSKGRYKIGHELDGGTKVYYNRNYVVDDIDVGNVGKDIFGNLKIIDLNIRTLPELLEWEFGPIIGLKKYLIPGYVL